MAHVGSQNAIWHAAMTGNRLTEIAENCTGPELAKAAGLDFEMEKVPLAFNGESVPAVFGIKAKDALQPLPGVSVGANYTVLQPSRLIELGEDIRQNEPSARWETAATLFDRRKAWALLRIGGAIEIERTRAGGVKETDTTLPYLLLSTTFDASQRTVVQHTGVRVVCQNTLSAAIGDRENAFWIKHTRSQESRMKEAAEALGHAVKYFGTYAETMQRLADTPMSVNQARGFFAMLLTETEAPDEAIAAIRKAKDQNPRTFANIEETGALLMGLFQNGKGNAGRDAMDALDATTEFIDHHKQRIRAYKGATARMRLDAQFDSTQFGTGAKVKARALRLLTR